MNATFEQVKPETLAIIEANAKRFGLSVDDYLRSLLPKEEKELALKADEHNEESAEEREIKRQKSITWIKTHREEYGGKYVALDGDKLIAVAEKYGDALKLARQKGYKNTFIGDVLPLDYEGFMGGLD
ncbi:MAG TPA: DUF5678 domain-containing protein [Pyrinomonadaceae bacterium]|nr:DUF5678 domain-containing protein [Pyrinomonadaceae bacterium]